MTPTKHNQELSVMEDYEEGFGFLVILSTFNNLGYQNSVVKPRNLKLQHLEAGS